MHHILVYECHGNLQEDLEGRICWEGRMPDNATFCDGMMFAWAVGQDVSLNKTILTFRGGGIFMKKFVPNRYLTKKFLFVK